MYTNGISIRLYIFLHRNINYTHTHVCLFLSVLKYFNLYHLLPTLSFYKITFFLFIKHNPLLQKCCLKYIFFTILKKKNASYVKKSFLLQVDEATLENVEHSKNQIFNITCHFVSCQCCLEDKFHQRFFEVFFCFFLFFFPKYLLDIYFSFELRLKCTLVIDK